jgi:type VII secretion effector (TIGR04197 family)
MVKVLAVNVRKGYETANAIGDAVPGFSFNPLSSAPISYSSSQAVHDLTQVITTFESHINTFTEAVGKQRTNLRAITKAMQEMDEKMAQEITQRGGNNG